MRNWRRSDACSTATEASIANLLLFLIYCFALFHDWNLHGINILKLQLQHFSNLYCVTLVMCHYEVHCAAYFKMARRVKQRSKTQGWILKTGGYRGGYSTGIQGWIFDTGGYSGVDIRHWWILRGGYSVVYRSGYLTHTPCPHRQTDPDISPAWKGTREMILRVSLLALSLH